MCHFYQVKIVKRYITQNPKYKNLKIQNTTNFIEGGVFSHMKSMVSLHRGLTKSMKLTLVDYYLLSLGKK